MRAFGRDHSQRADKLRLSRLQGPRRTRLRDQRAEVAWGRSSSTVRQAYAVGWSCPPEPSELGFAELRVHGVLRSSHSPNSRKEDFRSCAFWEVRTCHRHLASCSFIAQRIDPRSKPARKGGSQ